jgi:hypothetical protein
MENLEELKFTLKEFNNKVFDIVKNIEDENSKSERYSELFTELKNQLKSDFNFDLIGSGAYKSVFSNESSYIIVKVMSTYNDFFNVYSKKYPELPGMKWLQKRKVLSKKFLSPIFELSRGCIQISEKIIPLSIYWDKTDSDRKLFEEISKEFGISISSVKYQINYLLDLSDKDISDYVNYPVLNVSGSPVVFDIHKGNLGICPNRKKIIAFDW